VYVNWARVSGERMGFALHLELKYQQLLINSFEAVSNIKVFVYGNNDSNVTSGFLAETENSLLRSNTD